MDKVVTSKRWRRDGRLFPLFAGAEKWSKGEAIFCFVSFANFLTIKEVPFWTLVAEN